MDPIVDGRGFLGSPLYWDEIRAAETLALGIS
jgi:hypothetical protein